ncbi:hypothetical protein GWI33_001144 [Rhynchophorus ferrugineus]|uniref:Uncharacterized protein n=1 Tax=Rhynchophorus ferrugineus TaxID=354439 RepID=A0A834INM5_RHYFE|nr:hypothetical protein GWI33_001144 [Rhynchophorus ferrugineus]
MTKRLKLIEYQYYVCFMDMRHHSFTSGKVDFSAGQTAYHPQRASYGSLVHFFVKRHGYRPSRFFFFRYEAPPMFRVPFGFGLPPRCSMTAFVFPVFVNDSVMRAFVSDENRP